MIRTDLLAPGLLREAIYEGSIFLLPASPASLALVDALLGRASRLLGDDLRRVHERWPAAELFAKVRELRADLALQPGWLAHVAAIARGLGLSPAELRADPPRLRILQHAGHENPAAAPAYHAHRDVWYGNPAAQINVWIPLHEVCEEETFVFYPSSFAAPIGNDSGALDLEGFLQRATRSDQAATGTVFPRATELPEPAEKLHFSAQKGQILLFSAAQLHEPQRHATGQSRLSVDFRLVHEGDHAAGRGAPNVDNLARGSTYESYRRLPPLGATSSIR